MEQIAIGLLMWIAANSGYEAARLVPPPIVQLSPQAMAQTVGSGGGGAALRSPQRLDDHRVQGYYDPDAGPAGTIYLIRAEHTPDAERYADPRDNPLFRERLLHELVHFARRRPARTSASAAARRASAMRTNSAGSTCASTTCATRCPTASWSRAC